MRKFLIAVLLFLSAPLFAARVFEQSTVANLSTCGSPTIGNVYYVTDGADATDCSAGSGSSKHACVCNGTSWVIVGDGTGGVGDADYGDIVVTGSGATWTIDANAVVEANLKAVDAASDEECLTYESTVGDFEWQSCGGNSFTTINAPSGTDPVADSTTDTLNLTSGAAALSITGDSTTDTVAFDISGTADRCARFDGSGELVPASADCTAGDTSTPIIFDIGDDGGNDSTNVNEIATVADDYAVMTEPSADKIKIDFAKVPPYQQYDPDRPPSSCAVCDEFTGGNTLSWTGGNQGTFSYSASYDRLVILGATGETNGNNLHGIWTTAPSGSFTLSVKMSMEAITGNNFRSCGIWALYSGSIASPTGIAIVALVELSGSQTGATPNIAKWTNYTTVSTPNVSSVFKFIYGSDVYLQMRYDASADTIDGYWSPNGVHLLQLPAGTITGVTADPTDIGFACNANDAAAGNETAYVEFFRARTDADRNNVGE